MRTDRTIAALSDDYSALLQCIVQMATTDSKFLSKDSPL